LWRGAGGDAVVQTLATHAPTWLVQFPALVTREHRETLQRELLGATRERMLREIAEALETLTAARPLLLIFEDLQWVDPATVDVLAALARRRAPAHLLLVATSRPGDLAVGDHPLQALTQDLRVHQLCHELAVAPLSAADVAAYLAAVSAGAPLPEGLAGLVFRRSEGNPLFMRAVLDHLTGQGLLAREPDRWQLRIPLEDITLGVPESLRQMIDAQTARLSIEEQRALEGASVAGMVFSTTVSAVATDSMRMRLKTCAHGWCAGSRWCVQRACNRSRTGASANATHLCMRCTARCAMAGWRRGAGRGCTGALASGWRPSTRSSRAVWRPSWRITSKPGPRGRAPSRTCGGRRTPPGGGMPIGKRPPRCSTPSPWSTTCPRPPSAPSTPCPCTSPSAQP
jgi:hypothetical protein